MQNIPFWGQTLRRILLNFSFGPYIGHSRYCNNFPGLKATFPLVFLPIPFCCPHPVPYHVQRSLTFRAYFQDTKIITIDEGILTKIAYCVHLVWKCLFETQLLPTRQLFLEANHNFQTCGARKRIKQNHVIPL